MAQREGGELWKLRNRIHTHIITFLVFLYKLTQLRAKYT